jgi:hypothetical protein
MSRPFHRHVYPHPAHPGPRSFGLEELAAWDVELLIWGVRAGFWQPEPCGLTAEGSEVLDRFLAYYSSDTEERDFFDHGNGAVLLYMNQMEWAAPGERRAETEVRLAHMHTRFETRLQDEPASSDFDPHRHFPDDFDRTLAVEAS